MVTDNREAHYCVICGTCFLARKNARFCSAKCRKKASRKGIKGKGKLHQTHYDVARKALYDLAGLDAQNSIKAITITALELLDEKNKKKIWDMLKDYPFDN